jgi:hypothetical protein
VTESGRAVRLTLLCEVDGYVSQFKLAPAVRAISAIVQHFDARSLSECNNEEEYKKKDKKVKQTMMGFG